MSKNQQNSGEKAIQIPTALMFYNFSSVSNQNAVFVKSGVALKENVY